MYGEWVGGDRASGNAMPGALWGSFAFSIPHAPGLLLALGSGREVVAFCGVGGWHLLLENVRRCEGLSEGAVKPDLGFRVGFLEEVIPEL